jgi:hypothetical protein
MKKKLVAVLAMGFIMSAMVGVVDAAIIASSDFDIGTEGWSWLTADPGISWQNSGGNPDGYMKFDNNIPYGSGATASIYAPSKFLGNWSALGVTGFSYEAKIFTTGNYIKTGNYHAYISGPGGEYRWNGPSPNPSAGWLLLDVPLIETDWTLVSGNWDDTIANITEFRIGMAYYTNTTLFEITGIDNVNLNAVPIPASVWLLGGGLIGLGGIRRKKKK